MQLNRWVVIVAIVVAYFVDQHVHDEIPLLLLTLQLTFPLVTSLGFDPIGSGAVDVDGVDGAGVSAGGAGRLRGKRHCRRDLVRSYTGTSILMIAICADHGADHDLPADRASGCRERCGKERRDR